MSKLSRGFVRDLSDELADMRRRCEASQCDITALERALRKSHEVTEEMVERAAESLKRNAYLGDVRDIPLDYHTIARAALTAALPAPLLATGDARR